MALLFLLLLVLTSVHCRAWSWLNEKPTESIYDMLNRETEVIYESDDTIPLVEENYPETADDLDDVRNLPYNKHMDAISNENKMWSGGIVPFLIQDEDMLSKSQRVSFVRAIEFFHKNTRVRFIRKSIYDKDFILITHNMSHCFSSDLSKRGGVQVVNLDNTRKSCWQYGTIVHELMHCLGFMHEQSRNDRDEFVKIHWENIPEHLHPQFYKAARLNLAAQSVGEFDFGSIMAYVNNLFGKVILSAKKDPIEENNKKMGNRNEPTEMDIQKINQLYSYGNKHQQVCNCGLPQAKSTSLEHAQANAFLLIGDNEPEVYFPQASYDDHVLDSNYASVVKACTGINSLNHQGVVYVVCLDQGTSYSYDPKSNRFSAGPRLDSAHPGAVAGPDEGRFVICGGKKEGVVVKSCVSFDPQTGEIMQMPPLHRPRINAMMVRHSEWLFVFGGKLSAHGMDSPHSLAFEYLDLNNKHKGWVLNNTRTTPIRDNVRPAAFQKFIAFCGGSGSVKCEKFHVETFEWYQMAPLPTEFCKGLTLRASPNGTQLYGFGAEQGYCSAGRSVLVLDSVMNVWEYADVNILRARYVDYAVEHVNWHFE